MKPVRVPRMGSRAIQLIVVLIAGSTVSTLSGCATVDELKGQISERLGHDKPDAEQTSISAQSSEPTASLAGQIQEKLLELGYKPGRITGKLNSRTEAAIQDFQLDNNLRVDGKANLSLLKILNAAIAKR